VSFLSASLIPSALPMDTKQGSPYSKLWKPGSDTKLLWVDGLGRLEEWIWRRLYSNDVAGRGPGPRRRGGAGRCSRRAREAGTRGQDTNQSKFVSLHLSCLLILLAVRILYYL
jgi:hypothetical protein